MNTLLCQPSPGLSRLWHWMRIPLLCLAVAAQVLRAVADEKFDGLQAQFQKEVEAEIAAAPAAATQKERRELDSFTIERLQALKAVSKYFAESVKTGEFRSAIDFVEVAQLLGRSEKLQEVAPPMLEQLKKWETEREKKFADEYEATMRNAARALATAKRAADLEAPSKALEDFQSPLREFNARARRTKTPPADERLPQLLAESLAKMRELLVEGAKPEPDARKAKNLEADFRGNTRLARLGALVPRSELAEHWQAIWLQQFPAKPKLQEAEVEAQITAVLAGIKSGEDIAGAIQKLAPLEARVRDAFGAASAIAYRLRSRTLSPLRDYQRQFAAFQHLDGKTGVSISLRDLRIGPETANDLPAIRTLVLRVVLPRYLAVGEDLKVAPPAKDEAPEAYVRRVAEAARKAENVPVLFRAVEAANALELNFGTRADVQALDSLMSLGRMDRLGTLPPEIRAAGMINGYLSALRSGSQWLPLGWIKSQLERLRAEAPKEYEEAMKAAASQGAVLPR